MARRASQQFHHWVWYQVKSINTKVWFYNKVEFILRDKHIQWYKNQIWILIKYLSCRNYQLIMIIIIKVILYVMWKFKNWYVCWDSRNKWSRLGLDSGYSGNSYTLHVSISVQLFKMILIQDILQYSSLWVYKL